MATINKVFLAGYLGSNPERRLAKSGNSVWRLSMGTNQTKKDGTEETEWHEIILFGSLGDKIGETAAKGSHVLVEGRIKTNTWNDQQGITRHKTQIIANNARVVSKDTSWQILTMLREIFDSVPDDSAAKPVARQELQPKPTILDEAIPF